MGCLVELFFEVVVQATIELTFYVYIKLMSLIVPDYAISEKRRKTIRNIVTVFSILLLVALIAGLIMLIPEFSPVVQTVGRYILFISLGFISVQILLGIVVKIVSVIKKKN